jgi:hypothetical protein
VATVVDAARGVVCFHASDPRSVYLSARARVRDLTIDAVDRALYEHRKLIRMLAMRRTMFVAPHEEVPMLHAAAGLAVARRERNRNMDLLRQLDVGDPARWLREAEKATLRALEQMGEATAAQLARAVPPLREKVRVSVGKPYEARIGMSGRILIALAAEGKIVRGRPRGTWISSQYRWAPMARWIGCPLQRLDVASARAALIERWLGRFGPGTLADICWWTGFGARDVRATLAAVAAVEVALDGRTGYVLPDDLETTPEPEPWVALLPTLDPTTMGWHERDWYLGEHGPRLFDTAGNAGPTVWADGKIVGAWAARPGGEVVTHLLEDIGREACQAVDEEAARLSAWLAPTGVAIRFPTPLHKSLVA